MKQALKPVKARDWEHLKALVDKAIAEHGPEVDLNHIDVSSITTMTSLFMKTEFNGNISQWDVSCVTDTSNMFMYCPFDGDIGSWNVSNVVDATQMFCNMGPRQFTGDLSNWNTSSMKWVARMFQGCHGVRGLEQWDVSGVIRLNGMFSFSHAKIDLSSWNVSNAATMDKMFAFGKGKSGMECWNVSKVDSMVDIFSHYKDQLPDVSNWDLHPVLLKNLQKMTDLPSLLKAAEPSIFYWCRLIEKPTKAMLKAHPSRVTHLNTHLPILRSLGLSTLQSAGWLQKSWMQGLKATVNTLDLPEMDNASLPCWYNTTNEPSFKTHQSPQ